MTEKNWREMNDDERLAIQADVEIRQRTNEAERIAAENERIKNLFKTHPEAVNVERIHFTRAVNALAKRLDCLDKLREPPYNQPYPSMRAFLEAVVGLLREHGATEDDIRVLLKLNETHDHRKIG